MTNMSEAGETCNWSTGRKATHLSNGYHNGLLIRMQGSNSPILGYRGKNKKSNVFEK